MFPRTIGGVRCRINIFHTLRGVAMAVRLLSAFQNNLRACNLHPDLKRLTEMTTGLIVISGPTGSGKSTTLAALVEEINSSSARNIIAIESPLEYVFSNRRSFIRQREVPTHPPATSRPWLMRCARIPTFSSSAKCGLPKSCG